MVVGASDMVFDKELFENGLVGETDLIAINADVFIAPQPFPSWSLDANHDWQAPKAKPEDGLVYFWNEEKLDWEAFVNDAI